jgi:hypothetical protein
VTSAWARGRRLGLGLGAAAIFAFPAPDLGAKTASRQRNAGNDALACKCYSPEGEVCVPLCAPTARRERSFYCASPQSGLVKAECYSNKDGLDCAPVHCIPSAAAPSAARPPFPEMSSWPGSALLQGPEAASKPAPAQAPAAAADAQGDKTSPRPQESATATPAGPTAPSPAAQATRAPETPPAAARAPVKRSGSKWISIALAATSAAVAFTALGAWALARRRERRLRGMWGAVAKALGFDPNVLDAAPALGKISYLLAMQYERERAPALPPPAPVAAKAQPEPEPDFDPPAEADLTLAEMAAHWFKASQREATKLLEDPEFRDFDRRLKLCEGAALAVEALTQCGKRSGEDYAASMHEALVSGDFDSALTSLDVLAAYAYPQAGWLKFLVCLEAGEALLTLALLECAIRVFRPALMAPLAKAELAELRIAADPRKLMQIDSVRRRARKADLALVERDKVLVVDCYRPGWRSTRFSSNQAFAALFDAAGMTGAAR